MVDTMDLPEGYHPGNEHQKYVDQRLAELKPQQRGRIGQLWKEKQRIDPDMPNRGISFVKIMEFVAAGEKTRQESSSRIGRPSVNREGGSGDQCCLHLDIA